MSTKGTEPEKPKPPTSTPFTTTEYTELLLLAASLPALIFWTRGHGGDIQPLLMPVDHASVRIQ